MQKDAQLAFQPSMLKFGRRHFLPGSSRSSFCVTASLAMCSPDAFEKIALLVNRMGRRQLILFKFIRLLSFKQCKLGYAIILLLGCGCIAGRHGLQRYV